MKPIDAAIKDLEMIGDCRTCGNKTPFCDSNPDGCSGYKWRGVPPDSADDNPPLTMYELRELKGEPIWVVRGGGEGCWAIARFSDKYGIATYGCGFLSFGDWKVRWWAYRRKPEAEPQNSEEKPRCFYNDNGSEWCLGMAPEDMDEPIERCKRCAFCESGYSAEEGAE